MKIRRLFLSTFFCAASLCTVLAGATAAEPTLEQSIPARLVDGKKNVLTVVVENDCLGGGTDKNYTSGVRANYTRIGAEFPAIAHKIDRLIPTFSINRTSSLYYSFGQSLYTPRDIRQAEADPDDRPWAAFLYGSIGMVTVTDNHTDEVEATLGVIGPAALGGPAQKFIHKHLTDSPQPMGWSHQLKNEPGLMLAWQRAWPVFEAGRVDDLFWSVKPYFGATLGNVHTYGDAGFLVRLSPFDSRWQDTPLRVRPSMPGTGIYEIPRRAWSWSLFGGLEGRAVARDIFLDGNTFANSPSVDKKPFVADATAGLSLTYDQTRLSYMVVYRTKEFDGQDHPQIFGAVSLGLRF